jgi:hypothetical protein
MRRLAILAAVLCAVALTACEPEEPAPGAGGAKKGETSASEADAKAWGDRLLRLAKSFREFGPVDRSGRASPRMCEPAVGPGVWPAVGDARFSASTDESTHGGRKIYAAFAKDPVPYAALTGVDAGPAWRKPKEVDGAAGCSQVIVKEAFEPVEATPDDRGPARWKPADPGRADRPLEPLEPVALDGKVWGAGRRLALFVMFRLDPETPGTDDGWVYGTVSADGERVTSVGRVQACMACHENAPHGRLFGLPRAPDDGWTHRLARIAGSFRELGRVDEGGRMAPTDCVDPASPRARSTASADASTHGGEKVYSMFAKDPAPYRALTGIFVRNGRDGPKDVAGTEDCSQVLVKEAYEPVEVTSEGRRGPWSPLDATKGPLQPIEPATKDGKRIGAGKRIGLFVMFRLDPKTPGTDDGWVYGTVAADAKTVTSVGRVPACMACHEKAPHGRLFGLPK